LSDQGKRTIKHGQSSKRIRLEDSDVRFAETTDIPSDQSFESLESADEVEQVKVSKAQAKDLFRAPTTEEMHQLRETAELFKSNLFRMQIDELLRQVRVDYTRLSSLERALMDIKTHLESVDDVEESDVHECLMLSTFPIDVSLIPEHFSMSFAKPASISIVGSFLLHCVAKSPRSMNVDMAVEMPRSMFQERDYLNHRYHLKRAYFLSKIALHLQKLPLNVEWLAEAALQPILVISPRKGNLDFGKTKFVIRLFATIADDVFSLRRLGPKRNCIRQVSGPTSIYNNSIIKDTLMTAHLNILHQNVKNCESFVDACLLGKVWIEQRRLDLYGLNGFLWEMLMGYLLQGGGKNGGKVLGSGFSSYQLVRVTIEWLAKYDFSVPLFMTVNGTPLDEEDFSKEAFENFDVCIVDPTGRLNLANISQSDMQWIQECARISAHEFAQVKSDKFASLFMTPAHDRFLQFDYSFTYVVLEGFTIVLTDSVELNHPTSQVLQLLKRGLGTRVRLITIHPVDREAKMWKFDASPEGKSPLYNIGLLIDAEQSGRLVDFGPPAEDVSEGKLFKELWGNKAEVRRFRDGSIREAVVWEAKSPSERASIVVKSCQYLLHRHFSIPEAAFNQSLSTIRSYWNLLGNSTAFQPVMDAFTSLTRIILALELPLSIASVNANDSALAHCSVLLPRRLESGMADPINVVLQFQSSARWPDELRAIQQMKLAFYVSMVDQLKRMEGVQATIVTWDSLDSHRHDAVSQASIEVVVPEGYLFRCRIRVDREELLFDRALRDATLTHEERTVLTKVRDTVLLDLHHHPRHISRLHDLCLRFPSMPITIRLLKRWVASHMLSNHVSDELIELLVIGLTLDPSPHDVSHGAWTGFLRCLDKIARWKETMLIELENELTAEEREAIPSEVPPGPFSQAMLIATDLDVTGKMWHGPTVLVLERLRHLARASLKMSHGNISRMFFTPKDVFDVLIHLDPVAAGCGPAKKQKYKNIALAQVEQRARSNVWHVNHLDNYISSLQSNFGDVALFFHDKLGGDDIGILWNPLVLKNQPWKVSVPFNSKVDGKQAIVNKTSMLGEMERLGQGIVHSVSPK
jgi:U3 small nucleolar RNA-associated protein 22